LNRPMGEQAWTNGLGSCLMLTHRLWKMRLLVLLMASCLVATTTADLTVIQEDEWRQLLKGEWMVEFAAPWCPACRALQPTWEEFAGWSEDLEVGVGQVDVTASPGLSGRFMVTALPTIFHVKDGVFRQYRGARDKDSFISFVEEKKWQGVEPISEWKSPDSVQMSLVSYFFKLSMVLRNVHTVLTEDYQLPYWVSYVAFAVATVLLGGLLGLFLVCCIDCVYPPRREDSEPIRREDKKDSDVEEDDDDAEGSQYEGEETQEEDLSQDEEDDLSQDEEEQLSQEEVSQGEEEVATGDFRGEGEGAAGKARKRRARKAD